MNNAEIFSLRILVGEREPYTLPITERVFTVGSSPECNLTLNERFISRRHFRIEFISQRVYVTDMGSQNGTLLGGRRLTPHQPQEWRAGMTLAIADHIFVELLSPVMPSLPQQPSQLALTVNPVRLRVNKLGSLSLNYLGGTAEQHIYFKARTTEGFHATLTPTESYVAPGSTIGAQVKIQKTKEFWGGGVFPVTFMALTPDGSFVKADAQIRVRPRYELLLLLLLLLLLPAGLATGSVLTRIAALPTATALATITSSPIPTVKASVTPLPSRTPAPDDTAAPTITAVPTTAPTLCANQCRAFGWSNYVIQPGDTLSNLSVAAGVSMSLVQEVNCIPNASQIEAFTTICLPVIPTPVVPQGGGLVVTQFCDRSTNTVTFTVTNTGAPMPAPDTARIWDGSRRDLITPTLFQLGTGQSQSFSFSYHSTPLYFGNVLFFTASGLQSVSTDCMPATPPPPPPPQVITATFTPTPSSVPPIFSVSAQCIPTDCYGVEFCYNDIARFTVTNNGGPMSTPQLARITYDTDNTFYGAFSFQLNTGQSQDFDFDYGAVDYYGAADVVFTIVDSVIPPTRISCVSD